MVLQTLMLPGGGMFIIVSSGATIWSLSKGFKNSSTLTTHTLFLHTGHGAACSLVEACGALGCGDAAVHAEPEVGTNLEEEKWIHQPPQILHGSTALSISAQPGRRVERATRKEARLHSNYSEPRVCVWNSTPAIQLKSSNNCWHPKKSFVYSCQDKEASKVHPYIQIHNKTFFRCVQGLWVRLRQVLWVIFRLNLSLKLLSKKWKSSHTNSLFLSVVTFDRLWVFSLVPQWLSFKLLSLFLIFN